MLPLRLARQPLADVPLQVNLSSATPVVHIIVPRRPAHCGLPDTPIPPLKLVICSLRFHRTLCCTVSYTTHRPDPTTTLSHLRCHRPATRNRHRHGPTPSCITPAAARPDRLRTGPAPHALHGGHRPRACVPSSPARPRRRSISREREREKRTLPRYDYAHTIRIPACLLPDYLTACLFCFHHHCIVVPPHLRPVSTT
ncbi:hypothetical protein FIBSPDRAFT_785071 [Athelia psychrophila]|uniref:Uncharacterized protein n=1 Tax=Athelia psychrophila TaxID=1759441 RepID=A0A166MND8_9AGAM|nr:hypothetical protein FIBSPDRAFT_785071 [Fibularhizoctonia sp. CBS 109695]